MKDMTLLLNAIEQGDRQAAAQLLPLVYDELRKLAAQKLAHEPSGQTLQATALVHEAYVRMVGDGDVACWDNRRHFFASAAEAMRRILVETARRKARIRHGGGRKREEQPLESVVVPKANSDDDSLIALDAALAKLAECDPLKARLVEMRFFAGLSGEDAAKILDISPSTADRYWSFARAWLGREMDTAEGNGGDFRNC